MKTQAIDPLQEYLFDLNGYLLIKNALSASEVSELNKGLDEIPLIEPDEWYGYIHREKTNDDTRGRIYQQIYEGGKPFENLIDHPSWIDLVKHFVGGENTFDYKWGDLFIDENFATIRKFGEAIGIHSGGHLGTKRTQFRYHNGHFQCGQINILIALTDSGPGDGGTMVIPGSHKANLFHPEFNANQIANGASCDGITGAIEVFMKAGDAILFVDAISHGSAKRINDGERRFIVFRYGPSWGNFRYGYQPSQELLKRLTPRQRKIVHPFELLKRKPSKVLVNVGFF